MQLASLERDAARLSELFIKNRGALGLIFAQARKFSLKRKEFSLKLEYSHSSLFFFIPSFLLFFFSFFIFFIFFFFLY